MVGVIFVYVDTVYGFYGYRVFFFMLSWMFQHDYLDTYCFECLICMCFVFSVYTCSAQLSMFHMERCSRNMLIIIIIIIIIIICPVVPSVLSITCPGVPSALPYHLYWYPFCSLYL